MLRRGGLLAVVLLTAMAPLAATQPLPVLAPHHQVLLVPVPLDAAGSGSLRLPVDGGLLELRVDPILLPGPGGSIDVAAYLAQATLLLDDGLRIPLPSMVVQPQGQALDGPAASAVADAAAQAALLRARLDAVSQSMPASDDPQLPPAAAEHIATLQREADALVAQASLVQALADEAAGAVGPGAEGAAAIAASWIARAEGALGLLQPGLDRLDQTVSPLLPPEPSPEPTPTSSPTPSPSASPAPELEAPDLSAAEQALEDAVASAQAAADDAQRDFAEARMALESMAADAVAAIEDAAQQIPSAEEGALLAAGLAQQALAQGEESASKQAAKARAALDETAPGPMNRLDKALATAAAELEWAADWVALAQAEAAPLSQDALADANRSIALAQATVANVQALVVRHGEAQSQAAADAIAQQVAESELALEMAAGEAGAARDALAALVEGAAAEAGLDPIPVPPSPLAYDAATQTLCLAGGAAAMACLHYAHVPDEPAEAVTVAVAIPAAPGAPDTPSLPGVPPLPTGGSTPTLPPLPTGLPGLGSPSGSASASGSPSPSPSGSPSGSASASSSSGPAGAMPHLAVSADRDVLDLRMGEQGAVVLTIRNDGDAADTVRVTAQTDAPIALDTPDAQLALAPGESGQVTVRVTPRAAGSGALQLLASGEKAATASDSLQVRVAAAPAAAASIVASLEPTSLQSAVGQRSAVTLHVRNDGSVADTVAMAAAGDGFDAEPARIEMTLQPGESASRQIWLTARQEGPLQVALAVTSTRGADLHPLVLLDAVAALPSADDAPASGDDGDDAKAKGSPGAGLLVVLAAVGAAAAAMRRRLGR